MVKLIFLCSRRPGLSHAEYAAHLLERHAPLALRHHAGLRRYVLNLVEGSVSGAAAIDSVNALSYDALADFETRAYDSPEGGRLVTEDHARFLGGVAGYLTHESVVRAPAAPGVKWICALRDASRLERELVPALLDAEPGPSAIAIDRVERRLYDAGEDFGAFLELRFATNEAAHALRGRIERLGDPGAIWRVAEHVLRA